MVIVGYSAHAGHVPGMVLQHWLASCPQSLSNLGHFPFNDAHLFYSGACELLNGQQITVMPGARHPYPVLLAVLLKIFMHDFRAVTCVFTIVMALATWSAFEVIRLRLGGLTATVYLVCVTFLHTCPLFRIVHDGATGRALLTVRSCHTG